MGWSSKYPGYQNGKEGDGLVVRSEGKMEGVVPKLFAHLVVAQTILDMNTWNAEETSDVFWIFFFRHWDGAGGFWFIMHSKIQVCW